MSDKIIEVVVIDDSAILDFTATPNTGSKVVYSKCVATVVTQEIIDSLTATDIIQDTLR